MDVICKDLSNISVSDPAAFAGEEEGVANPSDDGWGSQDSLPERVCSGGGEAIEYASLPFFDWCVGLRGGRRRGVEEGTSMPGVERDPATD